MQGDKEDDVEAAGRNTGVKAEDKGGNVCVVVPVTAQVESAQGKYTSKGEGKGGDTWVVVVPAQGNNADDSEAQGDNMCVKCTLALIVSWFPELG